MCEIVLILCEECFSEFFSEDPTKHRCFFFLESGFFLYDMMYDVHFSLLLLFVGCVSGLLLTDYKKISTILLV